MRSILDIRPFSTKNLQDAMVLMESFVIEISDHDKIEMDQLSGAFTLSIDRTNYHGFIGYIDDYPMCLIAVEERFSILAEAPFGQITELYVEPQFRWEGASALLVERVEALARTCGWSHINTFAPDERNRPVPWPTEECNP